MSYKAIWRHFRYGLRARIHHATEPVGQLLSVASRARNVEQDMRYGLSRCALKLLWPPNCEQALAAVVTPRATLNPLLLERMRICTVLTVCNFLSTPLGARAALIIRTATPFVFIITSKRKILSALSFWTILFVRCSAFMYSGEDSQQGGDSRKFTLASHVVGIVTT